MHTKTKRLLLLLVAVALMIGAAGSAIEPMYRMRAEYGLTNEPEQGLSPELALATQALGWGRGIIIDVIWIRMEALKNQGRYFELVQLADWACKLAPRIPEVWDVQAWNMAYNISSQVDYLPDRWDWIWSGIELLRDEGLRYNPEAPRIYESLAYTLFHKIGMQDDYAHPFYKAQFARIMHEVLGGSGDAATLRAFAEAPHTRDELLDDADVRALVRECQQRGFDIVERFFEFHHRTASVPKTVIDVLARPEHAAAFRKLETYAKARRLRQDYNMEPAKMLALRERFADSDGNPAPFDWRSPFPHTIYWALEGMRVVDRLEERLDRTVERFNLERPTRSLDEDPLWGGQESPYDYRRVQLHRLVYAGMQSLVQHGRILYGLRGEMLYDVGVDYRFADATIPLFEQAVDLWPERYHTGVKNAYETFLRRGVLEFYLLGDSRRSRAYYELLVQKFPEAVPKKTRNYDGYLEWALSDYTSSMTFSQVRNYVRIYLARALFAAAANADEKADALWKEAEIIVENWDPGPTKSLREMIRIDKLKDAVLVDFLTGTSGRLAPEMLENLKRRVGKEKVEGILENIQKAQGQSLPEMEDIEEDLYEDPTIKPQTDLPYIPDN